MKCCDKHWSRLREVVDSKGLGHLVAKDGEELGRKLNSQKELQEITSDNYDPLISAYVLICGNALQAGGPYLLEGDYCPLCELVKNSEEGKDEEWIGKAVDGCYEFAVQANLVKPNDGLLRDATELQKDETGTETQSREGSSGKVSKLN